MNSRYNNGSTHCYIESSFFSDTILQVPRNDTWIVFYFFYFLFCLIFFVVKPYFSVPLTQLEFTLTHG